MSVLKSTYTGKYKDSLCRKGLSELGFHPTTLARGEDGYFVTYHYNLVTSYFVVIENFGEDLPKANSVGKKFTLFSVGFEVPFGKRNKICEVETVSDLKESMEKHLNKTIEWVS